MLPKNKNSFKCVYIFLLAFLFSGNSLVAQTSKINPSSDSCMLKGYYLLYRKIIDTIDKDHIQPRDGYKIFFVEEINGDILTDFVYLDSLRREIIDIGDSWRSLDFTQTLYTDSIYKNVVLKRNTIATIPINRVFNFDGNVPPNLLKANERFIAVYKGQLKVLGPFKIIGQVFRREALGYLCLKDIKNEVKYLYSIVLPSLTEEKRFFLPHAGLLKQSESNQKYVLME
jgi:hypothetical protein